MRDSMIFRRKYADEIRALDEKDQVKAFNAIFNYALRDQEPTTDMPKLVLRVFESARPMIDEDNHKVDHGEESKYEYDDC